MSTNDPPHLLRYLLDSPQHTRHTRFVVLAAIKLALWGSSPLLPLFFFFLSFFLFTLFETVWPICQLTDTLYRRTIISRVCVSARTADYRVHRSCVACCVRCCNSCVLDYVSVCVRACTRERERRSHKWSSRLATYSLSRDSCTLSADAFESSCQL